MLDTVRKESNLKNLHLARWTIVVLGFVLVLFVFSLPKIWPVTPPGFLPVIRISALDIVTSWTFRRAALKAMRAGKHDQAILAWHEAVSKNPANSDLTRGLLNSVLQADSSKTNRGLAAEKAFWLLKLTATNQNDLELAAQVYEKYGLYEVVAKLLEPREQRLSRKLEAGYLKALFNTGQVTQYDQRWALVGTQFSSDAELGLYRAAYQAGWGPDKNAAEGRQQLERAQKDPKWRLLAHRLQLAISLKKNDAQGYDQSLRVLVQGQSDTPLDHADYWRLLKSIGQMDKAIKSAQDFSFPPSSAEEAVRLANAYVELELRALAYRLLKRSALQFGRDEELWLTYANLLMEDQRWQALLELVRQIRRENTVRKTLEAYSYYLEGRAELGRQKRELAEAAFKKIPELEFSNPSLGLIVAANLLQLGFPAQSSRMLEKLQKVMDDNILYWRLVMSSAEQLKQADRLLVAAARFYQLKPDDFMAMNQYAAALIASRQNPETALKLTSQLLVKRPDSPAARINHSLACLLNQRTPEAEGLLKTIDAKQLSAKEATAYYFAWYQVNVNCGEYDQARPMIARIDRQYLFPNESQWLEESQQRISAHGKEKL